MPALTLHVPSPGRRAMALLLLLLAVCLFAGCDRHRTTGTPDAVEPDAPRADTSHRDTTHGDTTAPDTRGGDATQAGDAPPSVGTACRTDSDCNGYLRCMNATCDVPPAITGEHDASTPIATFHAGPEQGAAELARFYLELAIGPAEQQRGLMYRRSMQPDWGMLFIYRHDDILQFWMKNTLIPLDMIFIHSSGEVVGVVAGAEPLTLSPRGVDKPARYVLELNAGTAERLGIEAGTWMRLENVEPHQLPTTQTHGP